MKTIFLIPGFPFFRRRGDVWVYEYSSLHHKRTDNILLHINTLTVHAQPYPTLQYAIGQSLNPASAHPIAQHEASSSFVFRQWQR